MDITPVYGTDISGSNPDESAITQKSPIMDFFNEIKNHTTLRENKSLIMSAALTSFSFRK